MLPDNPTPWARSGWEWQGAQAIQGEVELVLPGSALGQMQSEAPRLAGEPSRQREEAPPEGLGGCHRFAQADARGPAGEIMRHHADCQAGPLRQAQDWRGSVLRGDG